MASVYIFCGIIFCHVVLVAGQNVTQAKKLRQDIFSDYDKKIRPIANQSLALNVTISFYLYAINGIDEASEVIKTTGYLWISWKDYFLTWKPDDYGGINSEFWPQDDVWKPDIALRNSIKEYKGLGESSLNVHVDSDGTVMWYPFQQFESTCTMHIDYFPFDVQTCTLTFVAWSYWREQLNIMGGDGEGISLSHYRPNFAWDIVKAELRRSDDKATTQKVQFSIKIKRKPIYVILSVILPISFLAVLNLFVFVLPCDSGERSGYAVTVFLSLAVFLSIVSATLPPDSDNVALLYLYLTIQTAQSSVITLIAVIMIRMNSLTEETKVPSCAIAMLKLSERIRCICSKRCKTVTDKQGTQTSDNSLELAIGTESSAEDKDKQHGTSDVTVNTDEHEYTWKHVIHLLDIVCLAFFSLVCFLSIAFCFGISMTVDK